MKKITILVPAYNESQNLPLLADALQPLIDNQLTDKEYEWEVLMVNDGSKDDTLDVMGRIREADRRYNFLNLSRNFGKENAMLAGIDHATGDAMVIMDADLQHPINVIPEMIRLWEEGYEDVYGRRISREKESRIRRFLTNRYYGILQNASETDILPNVGDFRLLDRRCVEVLRELRETQRYSKGLFCWVGFKKKEVLFDVAERAVGKSTFNLSRLLNFAIEGITSYTTKPLRFASITGMLAAFLSLLYLIFTILKTIFYGESVVGYPTLVCIILFLGGCQLIAIGIMGEYIGRIFMETKQRPPYIAESFNGNKYRRRLRCRGRDGRSRRR